jgi:pimeloyl-ACP methyl ester carboxylesterase
VTMTASIQYWERVASRVVVADPRPAIRPLGGIGHDAATMARTEGEQTGPTARLGDASPAVDGSCEVAGRRVDYCLYGRASPRRVLFAYGTPGSRWLSRQLIGAAERAGVQLLVLDRPGYGTSTRRAGRRIIDVVDDIAAVVDAIGWKDFAVWGGSGGAPHALACAATLPHRVIACASVVGPAPFDASGLDWFANMSRGNVEEFTLAARGEQAYRPLVQRLAEEAVAAVAAGGVQVTSDYELSDSDLRALQARRGEGDYLERMRVTYNGGVDGWIDDCIAMTCPWGFELEAISVPVSVWYGPNDVLSPKAHAEYLLAAIPHAARNELRGGHVLGDADLDAIYKSLTHV